VTFFDTATGIVDAANVAVVAPAGTVTDGGTEATCGSPLASVTWAPPLGAAALRSTVPVAWLPPSTVEGLMAKETTVSTGEIVRVAVCVTPPSDAEIVAATVDVTVDVVTMKVALVAPAGTVTVPGTTAAGLLLTSTTDAPAAGAAAASVTVPVADVPPLTLAGDTATLATVSGVTASVAVAVLEP